MWLRFYVNQRAENNYHLYLFLKTFVTLCIRTNITQFQESGFQEGFNWPVILLREVLTDLLGVVSQRTIWSGASDLRLPSCIWVLAGRLEGWVQWGSSYSKRCLSIRVVTVLQKS